MGNNYKSYGTIARNETSRAFFEQFVHAIKTRLTRYFGEEESNRVMEALGTGRIEIVGMENFLYSTSNISDETLELYVNSESADDFFYRGLSYFKEQAEQGCSHIEIREFLLALADTMKPTRYNVSKEQMTEYLKILFYSLKNETYKSPFHIQVLDNRFKIMLKETTGLSLSSYNDFISTFFETYSSVYHTNGCRRTFLPRVEILYPVFVDVKDNQFQYLATLYGVAKYHTKAVLSGIEELPDNKAALDIALSTLERETGKVYNRESIILELERIKNSNPFCLYPTAREYNHLLNRMGVKKSIIGLKEIEKTCVNLELYANCAHPYYTNVEIDCAGLKMEDLNYYIDAVKSLSLLKVYFYSSYNGVPITGEEKFKVTLKNVQDLSHEFVNFIKRKMKQLRSLTNREFIIDVHYDSETMKQKFIKPKEHYIRVISDIHADYNQNRYTYNFGDDFVINCGDTGGDANTCIRWNRNHIREGVVVAGNHLGYSKCHPELPETDIKNVKGEHIHWIAKSLTGYGGLLFMSNSVKEYEGIVILGTTLYTDFALYGEDHVEEAMQYAKSNMNDFKYITVPGHRIYTRMSDGEWDVKKLLKGEGEVRLFSPQDHAYYFHFSYNFLKEKVAEHRDKPIVIVTHHAPTPYAISPMYAGSMLNPAFASNLNEFIVNNPQIRLWCHGHVHNKSDIILGQTRVVCDPFGYDNENNADLPYNYGTRIKLSDIKSNKPWTDICSEEIKFGLIKVYEG